MGEDEGNPDAQAMEYARAYTRRQLGEAPASVQAQYAPPPPRDSGKTMRTLIVVAGLVTVAWLWFKHRKG